MRKKKTKKTGLVALLLILVLLISIGYAALSTNLSITGNATIKKQTWSVYFNNVVLSSSNNVASVTTAPTVPEGSKTTTELNWEVSMDTPGQVYEFTVDVVNEGSMDAMIETATNNIVGSALTADQKKYLDYTITYLNGAEIEQYDKLAAGETKTIKVKLLFKQDVNANDLPSTDQSGLSLSYGVNYVQADSNAQEKSTSNITIGMLNIGDYVAIGGSNLLNNNEVMYNEDENRAEWRVAKKDGDNIYLILSDFLPTSKITNADSMHMKLNENGYTLGWDSSAISSGSEAVATLTNSSNWSHLLAGSKIASATITGGFSTTDIPIESNTIIDTTNTFVTHDDTFDGCRGYWLSFPSASMNDYVCIIGYDGQGHMTKFSDNSSCGVRPIVCLDSSVIVENIGTNAYRIK